jgi:two-component system, cell cycle response regulator
MAGEPVNEEETTVARGGDAVVKPGEKRPYLLVLSGTGIGRSLRIEKRSYTMGRAQDADFRLDDEGISRLHAKVVVLAHGVVLLKDLGSTNGTFVNDEPIEAHPLSDGDRVQLGANITLKFGMEDDIEAAVRQQLFTAATRDPLTGTHNKRSFEEQMVRSMAFARRHKQPLSVITFDVDHFKRVNDEHGHLVGDDVLRGVSAVFQREIRLEDSLCRVGGEEFCIILPGISLSHGVMAAERLREAMESGPIDSPVGGIMVTVSLGVAEFDPTRHPSLEQLMSEADARLYEAKGGGRNRVMPSPPRRGSRSYSRTVPDGRVLRGELGSPTSDAPDGSES